jgi:DNA-binding IclR family transcriptional regulator
MDDDRPAGRSVSERDPVARTLDVLAWLATDPAGPWSVRQAARDIGTSPTTVHRIFRTFESRGLLHQDGDRAYLPGLELYRLCQSLAGRLSPIKLAQPYMAALVEECDETVLLGAYESRRRQMMFVDVVYGSHPIRYVIDLNLWIPIHAGATGLAILAFLDEAERFALYEGGLDSLTPATLVDVDALEAEAAVVREQGFARSHGQRLPGAVAVSAPVFDADRQIYGDVSLTIPEQRYDEQQDDKLVSALLRASAGISTAFAGAGFRRG